MLRAFKFKVWVVLGFRPRGLSDWAVPRVLRLYRASGLRVFAVVQGLRLRLLGRFWLQSSEKLPGPANHA